MKWITDTFPTVTPDKTESEECLVLLHRDSITSSYVVATLVQVSNNPVTGEPTLRWCVTDEPSGLYPVEAAVKWIPISAIKDEEEQGTPILLGDISIRQLVETDTEILKALVIAASYVLQSRAQ